MAAKLKIDQLESVDGSTNIILNNSITMAATKTLPAAGLTGTLPAMSAANLTAIPAANITGTLPAIDGSNLTGVGATTLNAVTNITVSTLKPTISTNPSATGYLWIDKTRGEMYVCNDISSGANVWFNIGRGSGNIS